MLPSIPRPLQDILSHQPELPKRIFHDYLTQGQLPEISLLNPLLQLAAGIGYIRNVPPRLRNRQRFGSTRFTQAQANLGLGFIMPFSSGFVFLRIKNSGFLPFRIENRNFGPSVEIRTRGLLNPIQARYQTSPHPDILFAALLTALI